ncbi:MAG TPA: response regulator [Kofleriaceae bacterium]|nr:response regulator [Kofleriaceae bacterium]
MHDVMPMTQSYSILIVEDERIVAKDLQYMLGTLGYDAYAIAASSDEAVARITERCPDLALMDIRIKGGRDGVETAELLRRQFGVPVVYLTAHADDTTLGRATQTQPYGYLMKPVKAAELRSAIEIAVHRSAMENQLRERERWFAAALRSIDDAVITVDPAGRITFANPAAERLTGAAADQVLGQIAAQRLRFAAPAPAAPLDEALRDRRTLEIHEAALDTADGRRLVSGSAAPVLHGSDLLGAVVVLRDVTERTRMQRQLELADRLASLGTLTSGVAHQINNPLAVVLANGSFLRGELDELAAGLGESEAERTLAERLQELSQVQGEITSAGWRIGKIVSDLKSFSRPSDSPSATADVARAIGWAVRTTEHEFRHRARVTEDVADLPPAVADEARLGQVFVNLLMNAAQAFAPGTAGHEVAIRGRTEGDRIVIEVRDNGPGIAPDHVRRIFEPFFTTKGIGHGTGLGLSVCHGIVTSAGGAIEVDSELGRGTTFRVILATEAPPARVAAPPPAVPAGPVRRGRILVVDDDPMVHRTIKRLLRDQDLMCADNGREALALFERGERFDLVLSDLLMPIMTGIELHEQLVAIDPAQADRVAFMTGGAVVTTQVQDFLRSVPNPTLEKPFGVPEIQSLVARMLGSSPPAAPRAASGES